MGRNVSFGQIISATRIEAGMDPDPALSNNILPLIKAIINREYARLYEDFDWPFLRVSRDITVQAGQRYYDLPNDMDLDRIERVDYFWGEKWFPLDRGINPDHYNTYNSDIDVRSEPMFRWDIKWTGSEAQIEAWPVPVTNGRVFRLTGIRKAVEMIADADLCDLDDQMIILFAASELLARKQSPDAGTKQQKAVQRYQTIKSRSQQTKTNAFSFQNAPRPDPRLGRVPLVAYVRNP